MAFFEEISLPERPRPEPPIPVPPWLGPPRGEIPGEAAARAILVRTNDLAVAVGGVRAYSTGFTFDVMIRLREPLGDARLAEMMRRRAFADDDNADVFRLGVQFADGRKATNLGSMATASGQAPDVVLRSGSGGGTDAEWNSTYWTWPLPPSGPMAVVCAWSAFGIAEAASDIDAQEIIDAAAKAVPLWE